MKHLLDIKQLNQDDIHELFYFADKLNQNSKKKNLKLLKGKSIIALFFENSTRTLASFQLAAGNMGANIIALNIEHSSTNKGESVKDTVLTLAAMKPDAFIIRHQKNRLPMQVKQWLGDQVTIINAGDGTNQHPSQGLLDLYTLYKNKPNIKDLKISIIGDVKHSRVANSLIDGLKILENKTTTIYAPEQLLPKNTPVNIADSMEQALKDADVIVMLRTQKERIEALAQHMFNNWHESYGLNTKRLTLAKPDAIIMHPGPMNRGIEISNQVADCHQSRILQQVSHGVQMRQAILYKLLKKNL